LMRIFASSINIQNLFTTETRSHREKQTISQNQNPKIKTFSLQRRRVRGENHFIKQKAAHGAWP
jgi:hypothetical protein